MTNFDECLKAGEYYQNHYLEELDLSDFDVEMAKGNFKDWDIKFTQKSSGRTLYYEVKSDMRAKTSGRLAIEYSYNNLPSGINATKAHYWVHYIPTTNTYYFLTVKRLKEIISENDTFSISGGDGGRSKMYLVPVEWLEDYKMSTLNPC